ncbi:MAG: RNA-binding domain-containing protein [Candidatus Bathyarchaeota archaeon]|jgi:RNA binding exosome subunit
MSEFGVGALSRSSIAFIDVSFVAHATEDEDKVMQAVLNLFPPKYLDNVTFQRQKLWGHHKNPIVRFETRIKDREAVQAFVENLSSNLSIIDKQVLLEEIDRYVEKGSLYLRLDKQTAFQGSFKFCAADPIRVRIRFRKNKLEDVVQICRERGMLP